MSDEQQDLNLEDVGGGGEEAGVKKPPVFSGLILSILKWAAIGVGVIILVVTTTVITLRIVNKGNATAGLAASSPEYQAKAEPLAYYDAIDTIRGTTADDPPAVFLLEISLGYDTSSKEISTEIGLRAREIQDLVLKYVSQKTMRELAPEHYDEIQADLLNLINKVMRTGKVKKVVFRQFTVVP